MVGSQKGEMKVGDKVKIKYHIIKRAEVPPRKKTGVAGKWQQIFDPLKNDEAIKFLVGSKDEARALAQSISSTIRVIKTNYTIHYRSVPDGTGYILYIWKEEK